MVPAYNEEKRIEEFLFLLTRYVPPQRVIVIDDGSQDRTFEKALKFGCIVLRNVENKGKGAAQKMGFAKALELGADWVLTMDADLQHDPAYIPQFVEKMKKGFDIIIGSRWKELHKMPRDRYLSNRLTTLAISVLTGRKVFDTQCGYRAIKRDVVENIKLETNKYETESELLIKALIRGYRVGYVNIDARYGDEESKINRFVDTLRFLKMYFGVLWKKS